MSDRLRIGVNGAAGRMGQRVIALAAADDELHVVTALEADECPQLGRDAGEVAGIGSIGVEIRGDLDRPVDVIIDFSTPRSLTALAPVCAERQINLVAATTGLDDAQMLEVKTAAQLTSVVLAPNMSLAVNLALKLARQAAQTLRQAPGGVDVEIVERHHRYKEDAPSGTALQFGQVIAAEMGQTDHVHGRSGHPGQRPQSEIAYHALRTGDNVGEHTIVFGLLGETIDLTVRGHTRDSYAHGSLAAAKFAVSQPPGLYGMQDVLGL